MANFKFRKHNNQYADDSGRPQRGWRMTRDAELIKAGNTQLIPRYATTDTHLKSAV